MYGLNEVGLPLDWIFNGSITVVLFQRKGAQQIKSYILIEMPDLAEENFKIAISLQKCNQL